MSRKKDAIMKAALMKLVQQQGSSTTGGQQGSEGSKDAGKVIDELIGKSPAKKSGKAKAKSGEAAQGDASEGGESGEEPHATASKAAPKKRARGKGGPKDDGGGAEDSASPKKGKTAAKPTPTLAPPEVHDIAWLKAELARVGGVVTINRSPVLTLWVAVVAHVSGKSWDTALTYGRYISGVFAHTKGVSLGIYEKSDRTAEDREAAKGEHAHDTILGRKVHITSTEEGDRAIDEHGKPFSPTQTLDLLHRRFGEKYPVALQAMMALARAYRDPRALDAAAYDLYTHFRPAVRPGAVGWGQEGALDLNKLLHMAEEAKTAGC